MVNNERTHDSDTENNLRVSCDIIDELNRILSNVEWFRVFYDLIKLAKGSKKKDAEIRNLDFAWRFNNGNTSVMSLWLKRIFAKRSRLITILILSARRLNCSETAQEEEQFKVENEETCFVQRE